ncbi:tRNA (N6-threonylcarbamoyladenosine(37)-N6)-methyltransferase TrmO [Rariglobus hedericola]|uniref:tRNA (N6-threonylcarbamoyladenosine(37)-N6)-methyltransferase TrmO n=1 Tax=Rariglobus hedericola TaxID=2597822 RepID=UPI00193A9F7D|nr:tRNA (N6-threonylcarbamoyladenosine(37)-N6)-methyltransferase TrmO [Rariglobus hedericola]
MTDSLTLKPIGFIRTQKRVKFQARHQPVDGEEECNVLELLPGSNFEQALRDLAGFDRVWLLWWFHRNETWRPLVLPPRGPAQRRGVFATRSPHRPNPLGMTPVRLLGIKGRTLRLGACDLVDGTPVFDVKPYVPAYDSFPEANAGWIAEVDAVSAAPARFTVTLSEAAETQAAWLRETWEIDFTPRLVELLSHDPTPHRTRRIRKRASGTLEIGCGAWRAEFTIEGETVTVTALETGYPLRFLTREGYEEVPDRDAQMAFLARWPEIAPTQG